MNVRSMYSRREEKENMKNEQAIQVLKMIETHGSLAKNAKELAIQALEKQIPKSLENKVHPCFPNMGKFYICTCGAAYFEEGSNYCGNCGQRLK